MDTYEVLINGIPHTVQLDKAPNDPLGKPIPSVGTQTKAAAEAEAKAVAANKSATPANKSAADK